MNELLGIHDIDVEAYHRDELCPEVSLSSSGIRTLLNETPAHFAARNPRLTSWPDLVETPSREQDLGSVIHSLLLGKGAAFDVVDFDDWRKKEAQMMRDASRASGKIPMLRKTYANALQVAEKAAEHLTYLFHAWPIGQSERTMIWQRKTVHGPIWCRALVDHMSEGAQLIDLKTTSRSIGDEDLKRKIAQDGGDIQAAWYTEGLATLFPELAGRVKFTFIFIEVEPPFLPRPITLSENWLTRARFRIDRAADIFAKCLREDKWPGWPTELTTLSAPTYLETKWETEELEAAS